SVQIEVRRYEHAINVNIDFAIARPPRRHKTDRRGRELKIHVCAQTTIDAIGATTCRRLRFTNPLVVLHAQRALLHYLGGASQLEAVQCYEEVGCTGVFRASNLDYNVVHGSRQAAEEKLLVP